MTTFRAVSSRITDWTGDLWRTRRESPGALLVLIAWVATIMLLISGVLPMPLAWAVALFGFGLGWFLPPAVSEIARGQR